MKFLVFLLMPIYLPILAVATLLAQAVMFVRIGADRMPLPRWASIPLAAAIVLLFYAFA